MNSMDSKAPSDPGPDDAHQAQRRGRKRKASPPEHSDSSWYRILMQVSAVAFVVVDARARTRKAEKLRESGVTDLDAYLAQHPEELDSLKAATILDMNDKAVSMFGGRQRSDFIGLSTERFFEPVCPVLKNASAAYLAGKYEYQAQARSIRLDGSRFDSFFTAVMYVPGGTNGIWLVSFIDITEELQRRIALDGLRQELAHASRISMLGEMSASIAHELGQPLSGISISAMAASKYLDRENPDVAAALNIITRISAQADRARDIMERVRSMAARHQSNVVSLTVSSLIREAALFIRHEFERTGTSWSIDISDASRAVLVDPVQVQQVIANLLLNAIQMMKDHGSDHPFIRIGGYIRGGWYMIEVSDNGPGIPPESMPYIFESFYTSRQDGLGLGLSICKTIIEAHGGTIDARNRADGNGAVLSISLPLAVPTGPAPGD